MDSTFKGFSTTEQNRGKNAVVGRKIENEISISLRSQDIKLFSSPSRSEPKQLTESEEINFRVNVPPKKTKSQHQQKRQENPSQGQQGYTLKPKSQSMFVKKKKKQKKIKRKKSPKQETLPKPKSPSKHIDQIVMQSTLKAKLQHDLQRKQEREQRFIKLQQQYNMNQINQQIRHLNAVSTRISKSPESAPKLPWGANEQRLRQLAYNYMEKTSRQQQNHSHHKRLDEKHRRQTLGLNFLNDQSESFVQKAIKRTSNPLIQGSKPEASTTIEQPASGRMVYKSNKKVKSYMFRKRKEIEQMQLQSRVMSLLHKQRKQENLLKLSDNVREIFRNSRIKLTTNAKPQTPNIEESAKSKENFSLLYEEYRQNFVKNHIQKQAKSKKQQLKQKFEQLSQRYQTALVQEAKKKKVAKKVSKNQEYILEEDEDPNSSRKIVFDENNTSEVQHKEQQMEQDSQVELLHYHYLNEAAKMIQKTWRGYHTRLLLGEYLQQILAQGEQQEQPHSELSEESDLGKIIQHTTQIQDPAIVKQLTQTVNSFIEKKVNKILKQQTPIRDNSHERFFNEARKKLSITSKPDSNMSFQSERKYNSNSHFMDSDIEDKSNSHLPSEINQSKDSDTSQKRNKVRLVHNYIQDGQRFYSQRSSTASIQSQVQKKELNELIQMREQSIKLRLKTQMDQVHELYEKKKINHHQFEMKCHKIQIWHQKEMDDLRITRNTIELSWKKTADAFKKIQRDLAYTERCKDNQQLKSHESIDDLKKLQREFSDQLLLQSKKQQSNEVGSQIKIIDNFELKEKHRDMFDLNESLKSNQSAKPLINEELVNQIERVIMKNDLQPERLISDQIAELPETHSDLEEDDRGGMLMEENDRRTSCEIRRDFIESDKQIEIYQLASVVTSQILEILIDEATLGMNLRQIKEFEQTGVIHEGFYQGQMSQYSNYCVQTGVDYINEYILQFFSFALPNFTEDMLRSLNTSYGFPPLKRMRLIHGYDDFINESSGSMSTMQQSMMNSQQSEVAFVLDEQFFLLFEQNKLQASGDMTESQFAIREMEHIHNKAIFDACNEALNMFRPHYYNSGVPYPWEQIRPVGYLKFYLEDIPTVLDKMRLKVLEWGGYFCGFIDANEIQDVWSQSSQVSPEKQKIIEEKNHQIISQQLQSAENPLACNIQSLRNDSEYVQSIREERLYKMLVADIKDQEYKWYNHGDDKTEFLMELADILFEGLVEDLARQLLGIVD